MKSENKKIQKFDEERKESYDEFEEFYGFPVGNIFLFALYQSDYTYTQSSGFQIVITPKSYWDKEKCCYDQHIDGILIDMPRGFGEACESDFEYEGTIKEAIKKLVDSGFFFSEKFQSFIENSGQSYGHLLIDGLSIIDYMIRNYSHAQSND
jgi:hypothetical protein